MRGKLLNCLPSIWWVPHDIDPNDPTRQRSPKHKARSRPSRTRPHSSDPLNTPLRQRKRTLSIPAMPDPELDARTNLQDQSLFFTKLPLELRLTIYEEVIGRHVVHFSNSGWGFGGKERLRHFLCKEEENEMVREWGWDRADGWECTCRINDARGRGRLKGYVLGSLVICRRMYTEAIPLLYTLNTFSLLHPHHLEALPQTLLPQRLNSIRTLRIRWLIRGLPYYKRPNGRSSTSHSSYTASAPSCNSNKLAYPEDTARWQRTWQILGSMSGLRDLQIVIVDSLWPTAWLELEEVLLQPVKLVIHPKRFELWLPYPESDTGIDVGGSSCRLMKPVGEEDEEGDEEDM